MQRGVRSGYSSPLAEPEPSFGRRFYNPGLGYTGYTSPRAEPEPGSSLRLPFLRNIRIPEPEPEPEPAPSLGRVFPVVNQSPAPPFGSSFTTAAGATPSVSSNPQPLANPLPFSAPSPSPLPVPAVQDPPQDFRSPELRSLPIFEDEIAFEAGYFCGTFSKLSRLK